MNLTDTSGLYALGVGYGIALLSGYYLGILEGAMNELFGEGPSLTGIGASVYSGLWSLLGGGMDIAGVSIGCVLSAHGNFLSGGVFANNGQFGDALGAFAGLGIDVASLLGSAFASAVGNLFAMMSIGRLLGNLYARKIL